MAPTRAASRPLVLDRERGVGGAGSPSALVKEGGHGSVPRVGDRGLGGLDARHVYSGGIDASLRDSRAGHTHFAWSAASRLHDKVYAGASLDAPNAAGSCTDMSRDERLFHFSHLGANETGTNGTGGMADKFSGLLRSRGPMSELNQGNFDVGSITRMKFRDAPTMNAYPGELKLEGQKHTESVAGPMIQASSVYDEAARGRTLGGFGDGSTIYSPRIDSSKHLREDAQSHPTQSGRNYAPSQENVARETTESANPCGPVPADSNGGSGPLARCGVNDRVRFYGNDGHNTRVAPFLWPSAQVPSSDAIEAFNNRVCSAGPMYSPGSESRLDATTGDRSASPRSRPLTTFGYHQTPSSSTISVGAKGKPKIQRVNKSRSHSNGAALTRTPVCLAGPLESPEAIHLHGNMSGDGKMNLASGGRLQDRPRSVGFAGGKVGSDRDASPMGRVQQTYNSKTTLGTDRIGALRSANTSKDAPLDRSKSGLVGGNASFGRLSARHGRRVEIDRPGCPAGPMGDIVDADPTSNGSMDYLGTLPDWSRLFWTGALAGLQGKIDVGGSGTGNGSGNTRKNYDKVAQVALSAFRNELMSNESAFNVALQYNQPDEEEQRHGEFQIEQESSHFARAPDWYDWIKGERNTKHEDNVDLNAAEQVRETEELGTSTPLTPKAPRRETPTFEPVDVAKSLAFQENDSPSAPPQAELQTAPASVDAQPESPTAQSLKSAKEQPKPKTTPKAEMPKTPAAPAPKATKEQPPPKAASKADMPKSPVAQAPKATPEQAKPKSAHKTPPASSKNPPEKANPPPTQKASKEEPKQDATPKAEAAKGPPTPKASKEQPNPKATPKAEAAKGPPTPKASKEQPNPKAAPKAEAAKTPPTPKASKEQPNPKAAPKAEAAKTPTTPKSSKEQPKSKATPKAEAAKTHQETPKTQAKAKSTNPPKAETEKNSPKTPSTPKAQAKDASPASAKKMPAEKATGPTERSKAQASPKTPKQKAPSKPGPPPTQPPGPFHDIQLVDEEHVTYGISNLLHEIYEIYEKKVAADVVDYQRGALPEPLPDFLKSFWMNKVGLKKIAQQRLQEMLSAARAYEGQNPRLVHFTRMVGLSNKYPYCSQFANIFFEMLRCVIENPHKITSEMANHEIGDFTVKQSLCVEWCLQKDAVTNPDVPPEQREGCFGFKEPTKKGIRLEDDAAKQAIKPHALALVLSPGQRAHLRKAILDIPVKSIDAISFDTFVDVLVRHYDAAMERHRHHLLKEAQGADDDGKDGLSFEEFTHMLAHVCYNNDKHGHHPPEIDSSTSQQLYQAIEFAAGSYQADDPLEGFIRSICSVDCELALPARCRHYWKDKD